MSMTDASASTTRKYATASTRAGTLSRVMTSCGGIVCVMVRRVTRTMRSAIGISSTRPGPFWATRRPKRNTTPRSYSRSTRTDAPASDSASITSTTRTIRTAVISVHLPFPGRSDSKGEAVDRLDDDSAAFGRRRAFLELGYAGTPQRPVQLHLTDRRRHGANRRHPASKGPWPTANPHAAGSERLHQQQPREREPDQRDGDAGRHHGAARRASAQEGEDDPGGERRRRTCTQHSVGWHVRFRHHQRSTCHHQNDPERGHVP